MLHVLVPTDFSNNSYNALFYATKFLRDKEVTFHLVNVCGSSDTTDEERVKIASSEGLDAMEHRLVRDVGNNPHHFFDKVSLCSDMTKGVADYAKEHDVDVMVIGNKAKEELKHILFGTNAMQLVREVNNCPILIVPLEIDFKIVDKIAFVSNFNQPISKPNVDALLFFRSIMDSSIVPMGIEEDKGTEEMDKNKSMLLESIEHYANKEVKLPIFKDKVNTIQEFVELWNIDMLAMVYYPHHFFLEFIGKGMIKELNTKLSVPFLILPGTAS